MNSSSCTHLIVGGGLSGSLALIELLRTQPNPMSVVLLEENPHRLFKGKAYSAEVSEQILNVPADHMSAYADQPLHLVEWLKARGFTFEPSDFIPRQLFGRYLAETVHDALGAHPQHRVQFVLERLEDVTLSGDQFIAHTANHEVRAQHVWIATGNFSPADLVTEPGVVRHPNYLGDPWRGAGLKMIPRDATVLLVGTGLTMVDQVLALQAQGHRGQIHALSRRGMYPQPHQPSPAYAWFAEHAHQKWSPLDLFRLVRTEAARAAQQGTPWTSVVNDLRTYTPGIWQQWNLEQRRQFLRHLRPYWEVHRHRLPAASIDALHELERSGQLTRYAARLRDVAPIQSGFDVRLSARGTSVPLTLRVDWLINCTGPQSFAKKLDLPWLQSGFEHGLLAPDPLALGIQRGPRSTERLHLIGPPRKGSAWESTALREIRQQVGEEVALVPPN